MRPRVTTRPPSGLRVPGHDPEQGALAGAVPPDDPKGFPLGNTWKLTCSRAVTSSRSPTSHVGQGLAKRWLPLHVRAEPDGHVLSLL